MIANVFGGDGLIVIVVALVVLVGGSQLPKIARNIGLAGKEFRKAQSEAEQEKAQAASQGSVPPPVALPPGAEVSSPAPTTPAPAPAATAAPSQSAAPSQAATGPQASVGAAPVGTEGGDSITLTPAQLDALLKAREEQARNRPDN